MIKKGVKVKILSGKDKNKDSDVIEIDRKNNRAKVKGINMLKKHVKTTKHSRKNIETHMCVSLFIDFPIFPCAGNYRLNPGLSGYQAEKAETA